MGAPGSASGAASREDAAFGGSRAGPALSREPLAPLERVGTKFRATLSFRTSGRTRATSWTRARASAVEACCAARCGGFGLGPAVAIRIHGGVPTTTVISRKLALRVRNCLEKCLDPVASVLSLAVVGQDFGKGARLGEGASLGAADVARWFGEAWRAEADVADLVAGIRGASRRRNFLVKMRRRWNIRLRIMPCRSALTPHAQAMKVSCGWRSVCSRSGATFGITLGPPLGSQPRKRQCTPAAPLARGFAAFPLQPSVHSEGAT